ncbi:5-methylcytosine-specific restriction system specificity protein McrC [Tsukamurella sp. NPDC003166]|uniref:5-methylcytosine restriction system specificity protein McrC n=1 Tax=Tsukamurella sp. NPDC003166 TaxID=3154444 RepID=UPI0033A19860
MAPGVVVSGRTEIPVRNLWLLMIYASELFQSQDLPNIGGIEDNPDSLFDVIADVLATAVERRLRRGLGRRYVSRREELHRVRGRIDLIGTERRDLLRRGRVSCAFDELSVDDLRNRLLHTGLLIAARYAESTELAGRCRSAAGILAQFGVTAQPVSRREAASIQLGRNDSQDMESIHAVRLLMEMAIPAEDGSGHAGRAPLRDIEQLRRLYERAVRGFYRATLPAPWRVHRGELVIRWPVIDPSPGLAHVLPTMKIDTFVENPDRRIVVETKFTDALRDGGHGPRLKRDHLFQLYAYVQSQHGVDDLSRRTEGVLLYPTIGIDIDESATIQGHRYRYLSVDLAGSTTDIRSRLADVVTGDRAHSVG